jgi:hypothetical protein
MIRPVSFAINRKRTRPANPLPAIRVERHGFAAAANEIFVQNIEHLEKRGFSGNVADFVIGKFAAGLRVALSPDFEFEVHWFTMILSEAQRS